MSIGENLKSLRKSRNLTLENLSNELNKTYPNTLNFNKGKISKWENNKEEPMLSSIKLLADYFNVTIDDIYKGVTKSNINVIYNKLEDGRKVKVVEFAERQLDEQNNSKVIPLVGVTAANPQVMEYADEINDVEVSTNVPSNADFALVVRGDSMEDEYYDGDIVFYRSQNQVENGELAIVEIEGDGVTFKKVIFDYDNKKIILRSLNEKYPDRIVDSDQARIIGKVVK